MNNKPLVEIIKENNNLIYWIINKQKGIVYEFEKIIRRC